MCDSWLGSGYTLRASQLASSQRGKRRWWITVHWGKSTLPSPANTFCLAWLQEGIPKLLSTRGLEALNGDAAKIHKQGKAGRLSMMLHGENVCLAPVYSAGKTQGNEESIKRWKINKNNYLRPYTAVWCFHCQWLQSFHGQGSDRNMLSIGGGMLVY